MDPNGSPETSGFALSGATAAALELDSLLRLVAHKTASDLGDERVLALRPAADEDQFDRRRRRYEEVRRLAGSRPLVPFCERPLAPILAAIDGGGQSLDGRDLVELRALLRIAAEAAERIAAADPPCPELAALAAELPDLDDLRRLLERTFDPRGEIRENATPRLAELRGRLRSVRQRIYGELRSLAAEHREHLSEETIPLRGGRLVLMLQAGARGRLPGLVHGRSGRGKSFYFEPLDAVEDNNRMQQASEEEAAEKRRILAELIARLRLEREEVAAHASFVAELDRQQAALRFAELCRGRLVEVGPRHRLELREARHPLLDPSLGELRGEALGTPGHSGPVVPLDLDFSAEHRVLVVTGPNAGGKTVALKTLGLLAIAHQCGLPIPAAPGSRLPFLDGVVATVGDDQDLLADRSTFSGRLVRLREAWDAAGPDALILLDELGSGTDPDEGAALATAIFEGLLERQSLVLITTHLSQVAARALEADGAFCAATLFDSATGRPTYRLAPGPPGGSEALALARRMGLPEQWLERAEELLGSEHRDLRRLLEEVEKSRQARAATRAELDVELADATSLRRRLAEQEAALGAERKDLAKTLKRQLEAFRDETARQLRGEVERLRSEVEAGRRKGLAGAAVERLFAEAPAFGEEEEEGEVVVGGNVRHRRLGWTGTLEKLDRGRAKVRTGGKLLTCRAEDLAAAAAEAAGPRKPRRYRPGARAAASAPTVPETRSAASRTELKLIGQRVEPALEALDRFLDRALLASLAAVRIVHGHGSGRLKKAVRKHLRGHPAVAAQRPGKANEGGDGATVVELAGD